MRLGDAIDLNGTIEGRVEVCVNRAWGTVCGDLFTQDDAAVVCNQLTGFKQEGVCVCILKPPFTNDVLTFSNNVAGLQVQRSCHLLQVVVLYSCKDYSALEMRTLSLTVTSKMSCNLYTLHSALVFFYVKNSKPSG